MSKYFAFLAIIMSVASAAQVEAQTYTPQTQKEYLAYLQGILDTLLAQQNANVTNGRVTTLAPTNAVTLRSRFEINDERYVYAWFEYGTGSSLTQKTSRTRIDRTRGSDTVEHTHRLSNLDRTKQYSYRAVFETQSGRKYYGATSRIQNTADNSTDSDFNNDDDDTSISNGSGTLRISGTRFKAGDTISVQYSIPSSRVDNSNWIGLFKTSAGNNSYVSYRYAGERSGTVTFSAPYDEGAYEVRFFLENSYNDYATSPRFTVTD